MEKFYKFQTYLYELSILVEALPQDGCDLMPDDNTTSVSSNSTTQAPKVRQQTAHVVKKTGHRNSKLSTCSAYQIIHVVKQEKCITDFRMWTGPVFKTIHKEDRMSGLVSCERFLLSFKFSLVNYFLHFYNSSNVDTSCKITLNFCWSCMNKKKQKIIFVEKTLNFYKNKWSQSNISSINYLPIVFSCLLVYHHYSCTIFQEKESRQVCRFPQVLGWDAAYNLWPWPSR